MITVSLVPCNISMRYPSCGVCIDCFKLLLLSVAVFTNKVTEARAAPETAVNMLAYYGRVSIVKLSASREACTGPAGSRFCLNHHRLSAVSPSRTRRGPENAPWAAQISRCASSRSMSSSQWSCSSTTATRTGMRRMSFRCASRCCVRVASGV